MFKKKFNDLTAAQKVVITTEKDAVRLMKFYDELLPMPLLCCQCSIGFFLVRAYNLME
jgi:tetraacyldisaccharide-1-P 4'-kinase